MRTIAIVPAKGESTRFPGKNFAPFLDTNLLAHAVEKLLAVCDEVLISSDTPYQAFRALDKIAPEHRGRVGVAERDPSLAQQETPTEAVVADLLARRDDIKPDDIIVLSQATSPLWRRESLEQAIAWFIANKPKALIAVTPDLRPCGAFYLFTKEEFLEEKAIYRPGVAIRMIPFAEGVDIDYSYQLHLAEAIAQREGL
jgi:CMP-N-acetylneuraminic acid synthetase